MNEQQFSRYLDTIEADAQLRTSGARILTLDDAIRDAPRYRAEALALTFGSYTFGEDTFLGIAPAPENDLLAVIAAVLPGAQPTLSFFRQSPAGQAEPHYIHSDAEMGDWTAILYLNPDAPPEDGTLFWQHRASGAVRGSFDAAVLDAQDLTRWQVWHRVEARFNRLLVFQSDLFHSRSLAENYGEGAEARLIHVVFGTGGEWPARTDEERGPHDRARSDREH